MYRLPEFVIPEIPKAPEIPEFEFADISIAKIKESSDEELLALLNGESNIRGIIPIPTQSAITNELLRRTIQKSTKPHWSVAPSFILLVLGTIAAFVAAYASLFPAQSQALANSTVQYFFEEQSAHAPVSSSPQPSPHSQSAPQGTAKK